MPHDYRHTKKKMIIESLLDTDLYKFTMMQCVLHQLSLIHISEPTRPY